MTMPFPDDGELSLKELFLDHRQVLLRLHLVPEFAIFLRRQAEVVVGGICFA